MREMRVIWDKAWRFPDRFFTCQQCKWAVFLSIIITSIFISLESNGLKGFTVNSSFSGEPDRLKERLNRGWQQGRWSDYFKKSVDRNYSEDIDIELPVPIFNIGFKIYEFRYNNEKGKDQELTIAVWYPSQDELPTEPYNYFPNADYSYQSKFRRESNEKLEVYGYVIPNGKPDLSHAPYPLLVLCHGGYGSGLRNLFLTQYFASQGYVVAATDYNVEDLPFLGEIVTTIKGYARHPSKRRDLFLALDMTQNRDGKYKREMFLYRPKKTSLVIDKMIELNQRDPLLKKMIEEDAIGVFGPCLGSFTSLGIIGGIKELTDKRVKAALLFSAGAGLAYMYNEKDIRNINIPTMIMYGKREAEIKVSGGTVASKSKWIYDNLSYPRFLLEIRGVGHLDFGNSICEDYATIDEAIRKDKRIQVINAYSLAFFDRYLKNSKDAQNQLIRKSPGIGFYEREIVDEVQ